MSSRKIPKKRDLYLQMRGAVGLGVVVLTEKFKKRVWYGRGGFLFMRMFQVAGPKVRHHHVGRLRLLRIPVCDTCEIPPRSSE